jgi:hypothetical protein
VNVIRRGYQGGIELELRGLPPHLTAPQASIRPGQNQVLVDLVADFDADAAAALVEVTGVGQVDGRRIERRARQPVVFSGLQMDAVTQHQLDRVAVGISGRGAELALRGTLAGTLAPGGSGKINMELRRREGIVGDVVLAAVNLPSGLQFEGATIGGDQTTAELSLQVAADATPGRRTLQVEGKLTPAATTDKRGKTQQPEPLVALAPIEIEILPLGVVELLTQTAEIAPGGSARLEFRVERNGADQATVLLEPARLPPGISLATTELPSGEKNAVIELTASSAARPSVIPRIIPIKPVIVIAGKRVELPAQRLVLKVVKP